MEFKLNIVNGFRAVFLFVIYFITILFSFMLSTHFDNLIPKLIVVLGIIILVGIFVFRTCFGRMLAVVDNENLKLKWIKKPLFTHKELPILPINEITNIVIETDQIIRKIYTNKVMVRLNTWKPDSFFKDDISEFLDFLKTIKNENKNIRIIDSWDEWYVKGYLKIAYWINTSILIIGGILIVIAFFMKGFNSIHLLYLIFLIPQLAIYQMTIKAKLKQKNGW